MQHMVTGEIALVSGRERGKVWAGKCIAREKEKGHTEER